MILLLILYLKQNCKLHFIFEKILCQENELTLNGLILFLNKHRCISISFYLASWFTVNYWIANLCLHHTQVTVNIRYVGIFFVVFLICVFNWLTFISLTDRSEKISSSKDCQWTYQFHWLSCDNAQTTTYIKSNDTSVVPNHHPGI